MTSPEAALLRRMNALKSLDFEKVLTQPQHEAIDAIRTHRDRGEPYINLHGPADAGKTFLCWALQADGWGYYQALPDNVTETMVIYDHGSADQRATRRLRNNIDMNSAKTVLYVTRTHATEVYPHIELVPSDAHHQQVATTWQQLGFDSAAGTVSSTTTTPTTDTKQDT